MNTDAEREAIRAERKVGQLLKVGPKATGILKKGSKFPPSRDTRTEAFLDAESSLLLTVITLGLMLWLICLVCAVAA